MSDTLTPSRKRQAVTIKHVAAEAGVSLQTVSRVINNGPNVTPAVKERVKAAIEKLKYVPSLAARGLSGSRSYLILALNDKEPTVEGWREGRGNDWVDQMLLGGMLRSADFGYRMLFELVDSHSGRMIEQIEAALLSLRPDGVILTPPHTENDAIADLLVRNDVPFARLGSRETRNGFSIAMDDAAAASAAAEHLVALGHRRVGFITGSPEYRASEDRLSGFRETMKRHDCLHDDLIQPGDFTYQSGADATRRLLALDTPPSAIIASSGEMALAVLAIAREEGVKIPDDLAIISFDDTPTMRLTLPPLTAIRQPIAPMAAKAAELLIQAKSGSENQDQGHILPFELIVRDSTGSCRR